jgi:predicted O-methyltransferase YrrM
MKQLVKTILHRLPYISSLHEQVKKQGHYPAGHYYSPIPSSEDILGYRKSREPIPLELPDIKLNKESQFQRLQEYQRFYDELPFSAKQSPDCRYYYDQDWFCYADAIFLYSFLRQTKPKRIVEVGSGFSSAVILDTLERFLPQQTEVTFIEPYPDRLMSILKDHDKDKNRILNTRVQEVPVEILTSLGSGDLLFIDSSHVVKCGSDVSFLVFNILPRLSSGVFVHFHDVFYPFEYPPEWLTAGRYWNEDYFLRAFLAYNSEWSIYFFNTYIGFVFEEFIEANMPLCLKDPGGSLYIQRT